jgi:hypothetical protein
MNIVCTKGNDMWIILKKKKEEILIGIFFVLLSGTLIGCVLFIPVSYVNFIILFTLHFQRTDWLNNLMVSG